MSKKFRVHYTVMREAHPDLYQSADVFGSNPDEVRKRIVQAGKLEFPGAGIVVRKIKALHLGNG